MNLFNSKALFFRNISFIHYFPFINFSQIFFINTKKSPKPHSSSWVFSAMTQTPYYQFIPSKAEEEKGGSSSSSCFPLHPTRYELVEFRDENPKLLNLFDVGRGGGDDENNPQVFNQFEIKKILTSLDVGNLGALVLNQEQVLNHICKYWRSDLILGLMRRDEQVAVVIRDLDTKTEYNSFLKKSNIDESCLVISSNVWTRDFVYRRDLKEGDTIGLYWDPHFSYFCFSVLKHASSKF